MSAVVLERERDTWRDRALEAEARLLAIGRLVDEQLAGLFVDEQAAERFAHVLTTRGPTIAAGQTWETRWAGVSRQAVILGPDSPTERPHPRGATFWRIRSQRTSTIREDVLRRRWQLIDRAAAADV